MIRKKFHHVRLFIYLLQLCSFIYFTAIMSFYYTQLGFNQLKKPEKLVLGNGENSN